MKKIYIILIISIFALFNSYCNNEVQNSDASAVFKNLPTENKKNIIVNKLVIDTIYFDKMESSYQGQLYFVGDSVFFVDKRFCWVYVFNTDGKLITKHLGQGEGPLELNTGEIDAFLPLNDGRYFFMGASWDCHIHRKDWTREKIYTIGWDVKVSREEMLKNPKPDMQSIYSLEWAKLIVRQFGDKVIFPIYSQHLKFSPVIEEYYQTSRTFAIMDINSGRVEKITGRRSPIYQKYKYLAQFSMLSYDISYKDKKFYVCFEPDSLIYECNTNLKPLVAFGLSGTDMNTDYNTAKTRKDIRKLFKEDRIRCGYYDYIEYIDERNLLFRSYKKGSHSATDGVQIYRNKVLIADIDVPKGMVVKGYIEPYFYTGAIIDEENETMKMYRFKLDL